MPYKDPEKRRSSALERKRNYNRRQHDAKFGPGAGDMRGKHGNHARGPQAGRWNAGTIVSSHGYVKIRVGKAHPLADPNGYAYEHTLVWTGAHGPIPIGSLIHHKNHIVTDNRIENLELQTVSEHAIHHNLDKVRDLKGRFVGKKAAGAILDGREWREMPR